MRVTTKHRCNLSHSGSSPYVVRRSPVGLSGYRARKITTSRLRFPRTLNDVTVPAARRRPSFDLPCHADALESGTMSTVLAIRVLSRAADPGEKPSITPRIYPSFLPLSGYRWALADVPRAYPPRMPKEEVSVAVRAHRRDYYAGIARPSPCYRHLQVVGLLFLVSRPVSRCGGGSYEASTISR